MAGRLVLNRRSAYLLALVAAALAAGAVGASVFVYYPVTLNVAYQAPPIVFEAGSNAGQPDLNGNTIDVSIGQNKTSATITIHPTYQTTYYLGVLNITNTDQNNAYYVRLRLSGTSSVGATITVKVIDSNGNEVFSVNTTNPESGWYQIPAGATYRVDIVVNLPEGNYIGTGTTDTFNLQLIYSTSNTETPP